MISQTTALAAPNHGINIPMDPGIPEGHDEQEDLRNGVMAIDMDYSIKFHSDTALHIDGYHISCETLSKTINDARQKARMDMYGSKPLSMSKLATVDLVACTQLYITASTGKAAMITLAIHMLKTGLYMFLPAGPDVAFQVVEINGEPWKRCKDANGKDRMPIDAEYDEYAAAIKAGNTIWLVEQGYITAVQPMDRKIMWDYAAIQMMPEDNGRNSTQIQGLLSEIKHRLWSLITPTLEHPVEISETVTKIANDKFQLSDGVVIDGPGLNAEIKRAMRGTQIGEKVTFEQTFDDNYVSTHRSVLASMGPMAKTLDTNTEQGRQQFEEAAKVYLTRSDTEFNNWVLGKRTEAENAAAPDARDRGQILLHNEVDGLTGEIRPKYTMIIETYSPATMRWITESQLSARVKFDQMLTTPAQPMP